MSINIRDIYIYNEPDLRREVRYIAPSATFAQVKVRTSHGAMSGTDEATSFSAIIFAMLLQHNVMVAVGCALPRPRLPRRVARRPLTQ